MKINHDDGLNMSYKIKEKINEMIEKSEKSIQASNKKTESISNLQEDIKEQAKQLSEIKNNHGRNMHFVKEKIYDFRSELREYREKLESYDHEFDKLITSKENELIKQKQKLNDHYYVLQNTFNEHVKSKMAKDYHEHQIKELIMKVNELEKRMTALFFNDSVENEDKS